MPMSYDSQRYQKPLKGRSPLGPSQVPNVSRTPKRIRTKNSPLPPLPPNTTPTSGGANYIHSGTKWSPTGSEGAGSPIDVIEGLQKLRPYDATPSPLRRSRSDPTAGSTQDLEGPVPKKPRLGPVDLPSEALNENSLLSEEVELQRSDASGSMSSVDDGTLLFCQWLGEQVWREMRGGYELATGKRVPEDNLPQHLKRTDEAMTVAHSRFMSFATEWLPNNIPSGEKKITQVLDLVELPIGIALWSSGERGTAQRPFRPPILALREILYGQGQAYSDFDHHPDVAAIRMVAALMILQYRDNEEAQKSIYLNPEWHRWTKLTANQIICISSLVDWASPAPPPPGIERTAPWAFGGRRSPVLQINSAI